MNPIRSALLALLAFGPAAAFAQPLSDADILNKIHSIDRNEIAAAELARSKSSDEQVKKFARAMMRDHAKADAQVAELAKKKGIALDEAKPSADPLADMSGVDFDRGYANKMVKGHEEALAFLAQAEVQTSDAAVKKLVEKLQPAVAHHKKMAEKMEAKLGASDTP